MGPTRRRGAEAESGGDSKGTARRAPPARSPSPWTRHHSPGTHSRHESLFDSSIFVLSTLYSTSCSIYIPINLTHIDLNSAFSLNVHEFLIKKTKAREDLSGVTPLHAAPQTNGPHMQQHTRHARWIAPRCATRDPTASTDHSFCRPCTALGSTWSAVSNLTSRAGELRSAPSGPEKGRKQTSQGRDGRTARRQRAVCE